MGVNRDFEAAAGINLCLEQGLPLMSIYYQVAGRAMKACLDKDKSRRDHLVTMDVLVRSSKLLLGLATGDEGMMKVFRELEESDYKPVVNMTEAQRKKLLGGAK